jgi:hypothetical protein
MRWTPAFGGAFIHRRTECTDLSRYFIEDQVVWIHFVHYLPRMPASSYKKYAWWTWNIRKSVLHFLFERTEKAYIKALKYTAQLPNIFLERTSFWTLQIHKQSAPDTHRRRLKEVWRGKATTFTRWWTNICTISRCIWIEQFANSSFDRSSSIEGRRTGEVYSLKDYEFMSGLLRRLRIKSTPILNPWVLTFLSTISLTCEQTKNGVMCYPAAEMKTTTDMCFRFLLVPW